MRSRWTVSHRGHTVLAMDCVLAGAEAHRGRPLNSVVRQHSTTSVAHWGEARMDIGTANLIATLSLVAITAWYAYSTAKMLAEMKRQAEAVQAQSQLLAKAAQISAWAALMNAAGHPSGQNPFEKLRALVADLELMEKAPGKNAV